MSTAQLEQQISTIADNFIALDFSKLDINIALPAWNNLAVKDYLESVEELKEAIEPFKLEGYLSNLPWNILHSLHAVISAAFTQSQTFINNPIQQHFHQAFSQVESLRTNIQTWGINDLYLNKIDIEEKSKLLDEEIQKSLAHNREIENIKKNIKELIEPAVSGALSKSFESRKKDLNKNQKRWFWASSIIAILALVTTYEVVTSIISVFDNKATINLIKDSNNGSSVLWSTILLRIGLLVPVYSLFGFTFSQYKKERNLEEEYAHKAAVATSLPNYGDLAVDSQVKDQILSEASKVIFTSPSLSKTCSSDDKNIGIEQVNQLTSNLSKILAKQKD